MSDLAVSGSGRMTNLTARLKDDVSTPVAPSPFPVRPAPLDTPLRLAYADPPYPGRAHLYANHPDFAGEVDHRELALTLATQYDGWALSTSAEALPEIFGYLREAAVDRFRLLAWIKHTVTVSWEPVIVVSARPPERVRDWIQCEPDAYQWREKPDGYVIGQKPKAFCRWMFEWLGARPDDHFDDLFPGSGQVGETWEEWKVQPGILFARSAAAERRADRRARARADEPSLLAGETA